MVDVIVLDHHFRSAGSLSLLFAGAWDCLLMLLLLTRDPCPYKDLEKNVPKQHSYHRASNTLLIDFSTLLPPSRFWNLANLSANDILMNAESPKPSLAASGP